MKSIYHLTASLYANQKVALIKQLEFCGLEQYINVAIIWAFTG